MYVLVAALVGLVAMGAVYGITTRQISKRKADIATVTRETQVVQARATALQPYIDIQTRRTARVALVATLAKQRFDWSLAMRQIAQALPSDVVLTSLVGSDSPSSGAGGGGGSGVRSALGVPAVSLSGCSTSQPRVAAALDSLRNIPGVNVVTLASSDKGAGSGGGGGACGGGPTFQVVVFYTNPTAPHAPQADAQSGSVPVATKPGVPR
jgi:Tfp pilus assembly protein PilN